MIEKYLNKEDAQGGLDYLLSKERELSAREKEIWERMGTMEARDRIMLVSELQSIREKLTQVRLQMRSRGQ